MERRPLRHAVGAPAAPAPAPAATATAPFALLEEVHLVAVQFRQGVQQQPAVPQILSVFRLKGQRAFVQGRDVGLWGDRLPRREPRPLPSAQLVEINR